MATNSIQGPDGIDLQDIIGDILSDRVGELLREDESGDIPRGYEWDTTLAETVEGKTVVYVIDCAGVNFRSDGRKLFKITVEEL